MSYIPQEFIDELEKEFDQRLRIRWSPNTRQFRIEQKVARAVMWPEKPILESDDDAVCIRDGYFYVMGISPRDKMNCLRCNTELDVPVYESRLITCPICKLMGTTYRFQASYFPLNSRLIDHLKSIDPMRTHSEKQLERIRENNEQVVRAQQRAVSNNIEAYGKDNFTRLAGIPQTGYTGKEKAWLDAKENLVSNEKQKLGIDHGSKIIGV